MTGAADLPTPEGQASGGREEARKCDDCGSTHNSCKAANFRSKILLEKFLAIWQIVPMKKSIIKSELRYFLQRTGMRLSHLAAATGVPASTLSRLLNDVRQDVRSETADRLRLFMRNYGPDSKGAPDAR